MASVDKIACTKVKNSATHIKILSSVLMLVTAVVLASCGTQEKKAGQALAKVNGEEITFLQINEELKNAAVRPEQQAEATKQLLESLIDRQLILEEAKRNKIDRTPDVMRAIERSKTQIIVQAYLQSMASKVTKPPKANIDDYYREHPEFFASRKEFDLKQLLFSNKSYSNELKTFIDSAKTLNEVAGWMDKHKVVYVRGQATRNTSNLPKQVVAQLEKLPPGQLFIVSEGDNKILSIIAATKDSPVSITNATPQIEQFLINKMTKEAAEEEIKHLRSLAKIEYFNATPAASQPVATIPDKAVETR